MKIPGSNSNVSDPKQQKWKKVKAQAIIFLSLFVLLELILRIFGMRAGTLIDEFKVQDKPQFLERFAVDELGINKFSTKVDGRMLGTVVNQEGFRANFEFTKQAIDSIRKATGKKVVMLVGDSFVEGCCADTMSNSFPDIIGRSDKYLILNFGISGTDPVQYRLIAQKYISLLRPDIFVTCFYFGNDIFTLVRKPEPYVALTYPFVDNKWIFGIAPNHLTGKMNYNFKTPMEAYNFYVDKYTLCGRNRTWFEKLLSYSVCFSKLYLALEHYKYKKEWERKCINIPAVNVDDIAYNDLNAIRKIGAEEHIKTIFVGIPAPYEVKDDVLSKYSKNLKDISMDVPRNLSAEDYDGMQASNHFNNEGHRKYADFLMKVLNREFGNE
ncbi:MAG: SGNH/GDSL hydrolase family protein [Sediminibacterium sp.]|nr:SGNH/GDSL hydrolase family protein [Sediminibacterium sp.]